MKIDYLKKINLPDKPGVYFFYKGDEILYIGKATSLKNRVLSYFNKDLIKTRGPNILDMVTQSNILKWQESESVLEALILEANLIKKYKPKYNTKEKDDKSFNYVCITKKQNDTFDGLQKVLVIRGRNLSKELDKYENYFGPFPSGVLLKEAMRIIRKIFPYFDRDSNKVNNKEFYKQLKLTPENIEDYIKNIKNIILLFKGKKKNIIKELKKEMGLSAKELNFEKAKNIRNKIYSLEHINDVSLIKNDLEIGNNIDKSLKIEAYDVAHLSGKNMVGVMTVMINGELSKKEYRKFIIKTQNKSNDTGALLEILERRFNHKDWTLPNLIVLDGAKPQINVTKKVLNKLNIKIPVVSVVKDERHKAKAIIGDNNLINIYKNYILLLNNEAHRFAINFHKDKRAKDFIKS
jgi:excinuclease ABC subunit C